MGLATGTLLRFRTAAAAMASTIVATTAVPFTAVTITPVAASPMAVTAVAVTTMSVTLVARRKGNDLIGRALLAQRRRIHTTTDWRLRGRFGAGPDHLQGR